MLDRVSVQPLHQPGLHEGAEGETAQYQRHRTRQAGCALVRQCKLQHGFQVVGFSLACVEFPRTAAHAPEVRPPADGTLLQQRPCNRLGHLVVHGAPLQRVRVRDQCQHARLGRAIERALDGTDGTGNGQDASGWIHGKSGSESSRFRTAPVKTIVGFSVRQGPHRPLTGAVRPMSWGLLWQKNTGRPAATSRRWYAAVPGSPGWPAACRP